MIGDKVPVITNTTTPLATGASVVTGSVQYLDVGIKLEVEPQIYAEGDVGIKLFLDVSNIVKEIPGPQGSLAYQIGTRSAQTNLRLRDGETQILGGLISELDRKTASKVPGLGQLPVLGRLFSNNNSNNVKTEIILSITPRIVRSVATADASLRDIYSGTESSMRQAPLRLDPVGAAGAAPAVVSGAVPGGSRPEAPSIERTPRPAPGTGGPPDRRAEHWGRCARGQQRPQLLPAKQLLRRVSRLRRHPRRIPRSNRLHRRHRPRVQRPQAHRP